MKVSGRCVLIVRGKCSKMSCRYLEGVWKGLKCILRVSRWCLESVWKVSGKRSEGINLEQVGTGQVLIGQVGTGQVKTGQIGTGNVMTVQVETEKSGQVKSGQVKSEQVKLG